MCEVHIIPGGGGGGEILSCSGGTCNTDDGVQMIETGKMNGDGKQEGLPLPHTPLEHTTWICCSIYMQVLLRHRGHNCLTLSRDLILPCKTRFVG